MQPHGHPVLAPMRQPELYVRRCLRGYAWVMAATGRKKGAPARAVTEIASGDDRGLAGLLARAQQLDRLDRALATHLDERYAPHVRVANVRNGVLVLATPVAPIATRLRMEAPALLEALRAAHGGTLASLEVRVTPDLPARVDMTP